MQTQQDYSATQGADFMKLSPGEQEAVDVYQPAEGDHKKKSVVGKVKDKAKMLKTKIKDATHKKKKDEHGNEVDESSSSGEEEEGREYHPIPELGKEQTSGYEASPEASRDGVVHGGEEYKSRGLEGTGLPAIGQVHGVSDPSAPAAGEAWPASHNELRAATTEAPSFDETQKRQNEVPTALGGESAGVSAGLATAGLGADNDKGLDNELAGVKGADDQPVALGGLVGQSEEKVPKDIMKPTKSDQLQPVTDGVDSSGRDYVASEVKVPTEEEQKQPTIDTEHGTAGEGALNKSNSQKGWMQRATEGVTSVKNALLGSPKTPPASVPDSAPETPASTPVSAADQGLISTEAERKTWTDKARETAVSMKDTISSKLPASTGTKDVPASEDQNVSGSPTVTSRAVETVTGVKDTVASKLGFGKGSETATTGSEADVQKPGLTQKVVDVKDSIASKLGYGSRSPPDAGAERVEGADSGSKLFTPDEHDTALSQKITDMLTLKGSNKSGDNAASA